MYTAIILAAGEGRRLRPLTDKIPKALIEIGGASLISFQLKTLARFGIQKVVIVGGYQFQILQKEITKLKKISKYPPVIKIIKNNHFNKYGDAYSLLLAQRFFCSSDFIIINSDLFFHPNILRKLLDIKISNIIAVQKHNCAEEEMKVKIDKNKNVRIINKDLPTNKAHGEYIGLAKFSSDCGRLLSSALKTVIQKNHEAYHEDAIQDLIDKKMLNLKILDTGKWPAIEIDFPADLKRARQLNLLIKNNEFL